MEASDSTPDTSSGEPGTAVRIPAWTPPRFFDAAAGLPPSPGCLQWLEAGWGQAWADPAGRHAAAARSRAVLAESRRQIADFLACSPSEVWFAPSADVALATAATAMARGSRADRVLTTPLERLATLASLDSIADRTAVDLCAVDVSGRVDPTALQAQIGAVPTGMVVLQAANREIGTVQPVDQVAELARGAAHILVDASAVRHARDLPRRWDCIVLEPSTWGGPSGVAVMACRTSTPWTSAAPATTADRFPGRLAVPLVAAAAMTLPDSPQQYNEERRTKRLADSFAERVTGSLPDTVRLGAPEHRLGHVVSLSLLYVNAEQLVDDLSRLGFSVQSGSACTADTKRPSHVLAALGVPTHGNLRVSLPPGCAEGELAELATAVIGLVAQQRAEAGLA